MKNKPQVDVDTLNQESKEAAIGLQDLLFGTGVDTTDTDLDTEEETEEEESEDDDTTSETEDETDETTDETEEETSEETTEETTEETEDELDDITSYIEPLQEYVPEGTEIKSKEDYQNFVKGFVQTYKEKEKLLNDEVEANGILIDLFENHPQLAQLARTLGKNNEQTFQQALFTVLGEEEIIPDKAKDPEAYADYLVAKKERENQANAIKTEFDNNLTESEAVIESFRESNSFDKKTVETIMTKANTYLKEAQKGKITREFLDVMAKGLNYEKAVQKAAEEAKVEGKNEAANKAKQQKKGDGLPKPKNSSGGKPANAKPKSNPGSLLADAIGAASDPFRW